MAPLRRLAALPLLVASGGCALSSTATTWNGRVGPNGVPVYVKTHTNIGINLGVVIPFLGHTSLPEQIEYITQEISDEQGDRIRMIESSTENYWYGFAPFTWVVTPVITTVATEYEPSNATLVRDRAALEEERADGP